MDEYEKILTEVMGEVTDFMYDAVQLSEGIPEMIKYVLDELQVRQRRVDAAVSLLAVGSDQRAVLIKEYIYICMVCGGLERGLKGGAKQAIQATYGVDLSGDGQETPPASEDGWVN